MVRLIEFAETRSDIKNGLKQNRDEFIFHLLKLFYHPECDSRNGWEITVYKQYRRVSLLKKSNKLPDSSFIYEYILGEYEDRIDEYIIQDIDDMNDEYDQVPIITDYAINDAISYLKDYTKWLSNQLSRNGKININDVRSKISELLTKYNRNGIK